MSYRGDFENVKLISSRSNQELSNSVSKLLNIPLTNYISKKFANSELKVVIQDNIRSLDVFIIASGSQDDKYSINDHLMEVMLLIDACRMSSCRTITLILPFFPYSRSDKKDDGRVSIGGSLISRMLMMVNVDRIVSMDLHSGQIQGFMDKPFDNLFGINLHIKHFNENLFKNMSRSEINENFVLVSPDNGGVKRIEAYAKKLEMKFIIMHKQRDYTKESVVDKSIIIGDKEDYKGKTAIVIDDMIDTMGTMVSASNALIDEGISSVIIVATHGVFSGPAFDRINNCDSINKVIVTNTLPQNENIKMSEKLEVVDTSILFAEIIKKLVIGGSISALFE